MSLDTHQAVINLRNAGFPESQAEAIVRAISDAQSSLVTKQDLQIELAPIRTETAVIKWMIGFNLAFTMAILWKIFG